MSELPPSSAVQLASGDRAAGAPKVDLQNLDSLQAYLGSFDTFGANVAEGLGYLTQSLPRFLATLAMVPPAPGPGARLLELGANPYFITLLLQRFTSYDLTLANYFGAAGPADGRGVQVITSAAYNERYEYAYDHFNGELDPFPYPNASFDLVLNCEILEHLTVDPTHYLYECHRILKPGGRLLLTTPNVLAWQNLAKLARGVNIYDLYSGYGVYGRHNREYTPAEAVDLVVACGFELEQIRIEDIWTHRGLAVLAKRLRRHWRDNLFIVARAGPRPIYQYPAWLYRSQVPLHRVDRSDIIMGENDRGQLGEGWYGLEVVGEPVRWTGAKASAFLRALPGAREVCIDVNGVVNLLGPTALTVSVGSNSRQFTVATDAWQEVGVALPDAPGPEIEINIAVEPTRCPANLNVNRDNRQLGVLVRRLWLR